MKEEYDRLDSIEKGDPEHYSERRLQGMKYLDAAMKALPLMHALTMDQKIWLSQGLMNDRDASRLAFSKLTAMGVILEEEALAATAGEKDWRDDASAIAIVTNTLHLDAAGIESGWRRNVRHDPSVKRFAEQALQGKAIDDFVMGFAITVAVAGVSLLGGGALLLAQAGMISAGTAGAIGLGAKIGVDVAVIAGATAQVANQYGALQYTRSALRESDAPKSIDQAEFDLGVSVAGAGLAVIASGTSYVSMGASRVKLPTSGRISYEDAFAERLAGRAGLRDGQPRAATPSSARTPSTAAAKRAIEIDPATAPTKESPVSGGYRSERAAHLELEGGQETGATPSRTSSGNYRAAQLDLTDTAPTATPYRTTPTAKRLLELDDAAPLAPTTANLRSNPLKQATGKARSKLTLKATDKEIDRAIDGVHQNPEADRAIARAKSHEARPYSPERPSWQSRWWGEGGRVHGEEVRFGVRGDGGESSVSSRISAPQSPSGSAPSRQLPTSTAQLADPAPIPATQRLTFLPSEEASYPSLQLTRAEKTTLQSGLAAQGTTTSTPINVVEGATTNISGALTLAAGATATTLVEDGETHNVGLKLTEEQITQDVLDDLGLTMDSYVYRWQDEEFVTGNTTTLNQNSIALLIDPYHLVPFNIYLPTMMINPEITARSLAEPGLNVITISTTAYTQPGRVQIRIRLGDIKGLKIYYDESSSLRGNGARCLYVTGTEPTIPVTVMNTYVAEPAYEEFSQRDIPTRPELPIVSIAPPSIPQPAENILVRAWHTLFGN